MKFSKAEMDVVKAIYSVRSTVHPPHAHRINDYTGNISKCAQKDEHMLERVKNAFKILGQEASVDTVTNTLSRSVEIFKANKYVNDSTLKLFMMTWYAIIKEREYNNVTEDSIEGMSILYLGTIHEPNIRIFQETGAKASGVGLMANSPHTTADVETMNVPGYSIVISDIDMASETEKDAETKMLKIIGKFVSMPLYMKIHSPTYSMLNSLTNMNMGIIESNASPNTSEFFATNDFRCECRTARPWALLPRTTADKPTTLTDTLNAMLAGNIIHPINLRFFTKQLTELKTYVRLANEATVSKYEETYACDAYYTSDNLKLFRRFDPADPTQIEYLTSKLAKQHERHLSPADSRDLLDIMIDSHLSDVVRTIGTRKEPVHIIDIGAKRPTTFFSAELASERWHISTYKMVERDYDQGFESLYLRDPESKERVLFDVHNPLKWMDNIMKFLYPKVRKNRVLFVFRNFVDSAMVEEPAIVRKLKECITSGKYQVFCNFFTSSTRANYVPFEDDHFKMTQDQLIAKRYNQEIQQNENGDTLGSR
jgi:hypothetical protein